MKKIIALFFLCLSFTAVHAANFKRIVIFGDSLTDPGYLYQLLFKILPKSPPYYEGRFSNGPTWAEEVGNYFYSNYYIDNEVYALGGATAVFHMPSPKFISPATLQWEVDKYLLNNIFSDKSDTLFIIWIGGNDYLFDADAEPENATTEVVDRIAWAVEKLASHGGQHFLVMNLPDLSKTPIAKENGQTAQLSTMTVMHNQKLAAALDRIRKANPGMSVLSYDIYAMLNDVIQDPSKVNQKYGIHLTNTHEACWGGGYTLRKQLNKATMTSDIQRTLIDTYGKVPKNVDPAAASDYILRSPELAYVYALGQSVKLGNNPCVNPEEHLFWDSIHPTSVVHHVLALMVEDFLETNAK